MAISNALIEQKFNQLAKRERVLLIGVVIALLLFIAMQLLYHPLLTQQRWEKQQQNDLHIQREQLLSEMAALQARLAQHSASPEITQLQTDLAATEAAIRAKTQQLIPPSEMAAVLRQVLQQQKGIELLTLQHQTEQRANAAEGSAVQYYKHPLHIAVRGNFFDIVAYLQALENLRWQLQWEKLDYSVHDYPVAIVNVDVATVSEQQEWLQ